MSKEHCDSKLEDLLTLMANSDFDADEEEEHEVNFQDIKDKFTHILKSN